MRTIAIIFLYLIPILSFADEALPKVGLAKFVIEHLDVRSFESSLSKQKEKSKVHFGDFGIIPRTVEEGSARLSAANSAAGFDFVILNHTSNEITICLHDLGASPENDYVQQALVLVQDLSKHMLISDKKKHVVNGCNDFAR